MNCCCVFTLYESGTAAIRECTVSHHSVLKHSQSSPWSYAPFGFCGGAMEAVGDWRGAYCGGLEAWICGWNAPAACGPGLGPWPGEEKGKG